MIDLIKKANFEVVDLNDYRKLLHEFFDLNDMGVQRYKLRFEEYKFDIDMEDEEDMGRSILISERDLDVEFDTLKDTLDEYGEFGYTFMAVDNMEYHSITCLCRTNLMKYDKENMILMIDYRQYLDEFIERKVPFQYPGPGSVFNHYLKKC